MLFAAHPTFHVSVEQALYSERPFGWIRRPRDSYEPALTVHGVILEQRVLQVHQGDEGRSNLPRNSNSTVFSAGLLPQRKTNQPMFACRDLASNAVRVDSLPELDGTKAPVDFDDGEELDDIEAELE